MKWAVVSDLAPNKVRAAIVSEALAQAGVVNEVVFFEATQATLLDVIQNCESKGIQHLRFEGTLPDFVPGCFTNLPSTILTLKSADAVVPEENGRLWPRNFLQEGIQRLAASDLGDLDLNAGAFIVGATPEARSAVAALVRIGFRRVNLTGTDDKRGEEMISDFRRTYFNVHFSFIPRSLITQLPGVHSVAVNTLPMEEDANRLGELFYFNFLKSGAVWIEVPFTNSNSPLIQEAKNVGADVRESANLASRCDQAWAESCFKVRIDHENLRSQFVKALLPRETD